MLIKRFAFVWLTILLSGFVIEANAQTSSVFTVGLNNPSKIIYARQHRYFFVSESGIASAPNSGRVSIVLMNGERIPLIEGLPSGPAAPEGHPSGPAPMVLRGNNLYIGIGGGNATINGPAPGSEVPNPNPNSPIFSSILELRLPPQAFFPRSRRVYQLSPLDHIRLFNGETITFGPGVQRARLRVVANFPDFVPNPRPDVPNNVPTSNPAGLALSEDTLYVVDASQNALRTVDVDEGTIETLINYPARPNPLVPLGPPFIDAVPDSVRLFDGKLLITFLTGFPFPAGRADVRQYDLESGVESPLISGLTAAIDILAVNDGGFCSTAYTLEYSTNFLANAPGRLQRYDTPNGPPTVISTTLTSPTSMARDPESGNLFITEIFTGRIIRVVVP